MPALQSDPRRAWPGVGVMLADPILPMTLPTRRPFDRELRTQALKIPEDLAKAIALAPGQTETLRSSVVSLVHLLADGIERQKEGDDSAAIQ